MVLKSHSKTFHVLINLIELGLVEPRKRPLQFFASCFEIASLKQPKSDETRKWISKLNGATNQKYPKPRVFLKWIQNS